MLSIFYFVISMAAFTAASYYLLEIIAMYFVESRICNFSLGVAQDHLMENGRGFFDDRNYEAVMIEAQIRTFLVAGFYVLLMLLTMLLVSKDWAFWIVPKWSIKLGVLLGIFINGAFSFLISATTRTSIGRLEEIDDHGIAHFKGISNEDFTFDVGRYWDPEDYPPVGWKFMVLRFVLFAGLAPLELNADYGD